MKSLFHYYKSLNDSIGHLQRNHEFLRNKYDALFLEKSQRNKILQSQKMKLFEDTSQILTQISSIRSFSKSVKVHKESNSQEKVCFLFESFKNFKVKQESNIFEIEEENRQALEEIDNYERNKIASKKEIDSLELQLASKLQEIAHLTKNTQDLRSERFVYSFLTVLEGN